MNRSTGWYRRNPDGTLTVYLHVQAGARQAGIDGLYGDRLKVKVSKPAHAGEANRAVIETLAQAFQVPRSSVSIEKGAGARSKTIHVAAEVANPEAVLA